MQGNQLFRGQPIFRLHHLRQILGNRDAFRLLRPHLALGFCLDLGVCTVPCHALSRLLDVYRAVRLPRDWLAGWHISHLSLKFTLHWEKISHEWGAAVKSAPPQNFSRVGGPREILRFLAKFAHTHLPAPVQAFCLSAPFRLAFSPAFRHGLSPKGAFVCAPSATMRSCAFGRFPTHTVSRKGSTHAGN